jgi:hypothetical protein
VLHARSLGAAFLTVIPTPPLTTFRCGTLCARIRRSVITHGVIAEPGGRFLGAFGTLVDPPT